MDGQFGDSTRSVKAAATQGLPGQPLASRVAAPRGGEPSVAELFARVERHLEQNPGDGRGWEVVAPIYLRLLLRIWGNPVSQAAAQRVSFAPPASVLLRRARGVGGAFRRSLGTIRGKAFRGECAKRSYRPGYALTPSGPRRGAHFCHTVLSSATEIGERRRKEPRDRPGAANSSPPSWQNRPRPREAARRSGALLRQVVAGERLL